MIMSCSDDDNDSKSDSSPSPYGEWTYDYTSAIVEKTEMTAEAFVQKYNYSNDNIEGAIKKEEEKYIEIKIGIFENKTATYNGVSTTWSKGDAENEYVVKNGESELSLYYTDKGTMIYKKDYTHFPKSAGIPILDSTIVVNFKK